MKTLLSTLAISAAIIAGSAFSAQAHPGAHHHKAKGPVVVVTKPAAVAKRHYVRRNFDHWRPGLVKRHYRGFGKAVYRAGHYHVHAIDPHDRAVVLIISATTGAIIHSALHH